MQLPEILGLITSIFGFISLLILIVLLVQKQTKNDSQKEDFSSLTDTLKHQVDDVQREITKSLFESMTSFNQNVNQQLLDTNQKSNESITEFRINVNKELVSFDEKIREKLSKEFQTLTDSLQQKMVLINEKVDERLSKGFSETNLTFVQIAERVKVIDEAQKKIEGLSNEMIGLQNILSNNQARGSFGEYQLNQLLFSVFGENQNLYMTQYTIKESKGKQDSVRADAVVFMPEPNGMIAIDSKFPFSSYSKLFDNQSLSKEDEEKLIQAFGNEVKKHITDIANKYIIPGVTSDYALMFVASDGILSLLHSKLTRIVEYARDKRVTIVSPTTLIPLLSSYKAVTIDYERSKYTQEINKQLLMLNKEFRLFGDEWNKLNNNIVNLTKQSVSVNTRVEKIQSKFGQIKNVDFIEDGQNTGENNVLEEENN